MRKATTTLFLMGVLAGGMTMTSLPTLAQTPTAPTKQHGKTNVDKKEDRKERKKLDLDLTADQKTKLKAIRASYKGKIQAIRQNTTLTPQQKREQLKPILKAERDETNTVLTPAQQAKMAKFRKEEHRENKMGKLGKK